MTIRTIAILGLAFAGCGEVAAGNRPETDAGTGGAADGGSGRGAPDATGSGGSIQVADGGGSGGKVGTGGAESGGAAGTGGVEGSGGITGSGGASGGGGTPGTGGAMVDASPPGPTVQACVGKACPTGTGGDCRMLLNEIGGLFCINGVFTSSGIPGGTVVCRDGVPYHDCLVAPFDNGIYGCARSTDCKSGACWEATCIPVVTNQPPGAACGADSECAHGYCNTMKGKCGSVDGSECGSMTECESGVCLPDAHGAYRCRRLAPGEICGSFSDIPRRPLCATGLCKGYGLPDGVTCQAAAGGLCTQNYNCLSNVCVADALGSLSHCQ